MIFVPLVFFSLFFIYKWKKNGTIFNIGSIITIYYIVSSFFSVFYYYFIVNKTIPLYFLPTFLYCFFISLCINPFYKLDLQMRSFRTFTDDNHIFKIFSWILIILSLIYLGYIGSSVYSSLISDMGHIRRVSYLEDSAVSFPWYIYPSVYAKEFSSIILLFFFYSITFLKNSRIFNVLLFVSSLVLPISGVISASRTQVVYWLMTASVLLLIFWKHMPKKSRTLVSLMIVFALLISFVYLRIVTVSRFKDLASNSLIDYIGQPYVQFCNIFNHYSFDGVITFDRIFPITSKYILNHDYNVRSFRAYHTVRIGTQTGVFLTYLGDAMLDFGKIGMVIFAFIIWIIEEYYVNLIKHKDLSLSNMIVLTILFRIPLLGLFAYMYLSIATSVLIIGSLFFSYCFSNYKIKLSCKSKFR